MKEQQSSIFRFLIYSKWEWIGTFIWSVSFHSVILHWNVVWLFFHLVMSDEFYWFLTALLTFPVESTLERFHSNVYHWVGANFLLSQAISFLGVPKDITGHSGKASITALAINKQQQQMESHLCDKFLAITVEWRLAWSAVKWREMANKEAIACVEDKNAASQTDASKRELLLQD